MLNGKVVVVTGAARGMGRAYVRALLERGARVVATDRAWAPSGVSSDSEDFLAELNKFIAEPFGRLVHPRLIEWKAEYEMEHLIAVCDVIF